MKDLKVGTKVYREVFSRNNPTKIKESTVTRIGRTYFYLDGDEKTAINLSTLYHDHKDFSQYSFQVYITEKEIIDKWEQSELYSKVRKFFDGYNSKNIELEKLKEIAKILNIE